MKGFLYDSKKLKSLPTFKDVIKLGKHVVF